MSNSNAETPLGAEPFRPHPLLRSRHLQTVWGPLWRNHPPLQQRQEKLALRDGDHLWLTWAGPTPRQGRPIVLILHGLSGCYDSHYARGLQTCLAAQSVTSVVMNARGTAHRHNDRACIYHAGETADLHDVISDLRTRNPGGVILPVGYSLGGSRLLNYLADTPARCIPAAVAVSVPLQLALCSAQLDRGVARVYRNRLLRELLQQLDAKKTHLRQVAPAQARRLEALGHLDGVRTFRDFDDYIVAPLHGFAGADDYYDRCSAGPRLTAVRTPTLLIHATDDPFMTPAVVPTSDTVSQAVQLEISPHGGHVGFVAGHLNAPVYWLEQRIPAFFAPWL
ncbi:hydrolase [Alcanivorax sp. JB21]|uniref:hydrolase n=1 Tax=Alcanivorax limicola TaxID=2874102 RepID=UPI001CBA8D15|nr:hydrolase [Alcanivorax limicola]MBZ2189099.1 hydrolase [Alcanivorax limicola]